MGPGHEKIGPKRILLELQGRIIPNESIISIIDEIITLKFNHV